jgi:uncharacterized protein
MRKHSFAALVFLLSMQKLSAQSTDNLDVERTMSWLDAEKYDSLTGLVAPRASGYLNKEVFRHIRAALFYRGSIAIDTITTTNVGDKRIVSATLADVPCTLTLTFDGQHRLSQIYLDPPPYGRGYRDAAYADTAFYEERSVLVQSGPFILPGTLTLPRGKQNFPIVVFVHGSGSNNRDEALYALKPFRDISLGLAAKGIATLRYDKRTKVYPGASALPPGALMSIEAETTDDAHAAIALAATVPGVDTSGIYVLGHSLGGMMTPHIVAENPLLAGAIILSGPARPYWQTIEDQYRHFNMDESVRANALAQLAMIKRVDTVADPARMLLNEPAAWWAGLQHYDQLQTIRGLHQPVLLLQGQRDCQVPVSDIQLWEKAARRKKNVTVKVYPKLNHYYSEGKGEMSTSEEYYIPGTVPGYVVNDIAEWIQAVRK